VASHLENLETILTYIVEKTSADKMVDILYERIKFMVEEHITQRDLENFVAYFKFLLGTAHIPKKLIFEPKLVQAFIHRTYAECTDQTQTERGKILYEYLKTKIDKGTEMNTVNLKQLAKGFKQTRIPSLEKLMDRMRIAMILKWLQGPLQDKLSGGLKDYIAYLATIYGQYKTNRVFNVEWQVYDVSKKDLVVLRDEYEIFDKALKDAARLIRVARVKRVTSEEYQEQFRVVFDSLDNLVKMKERGEFAPGDLFKDKIIVSTTLIYIQDEYVKKDAELKKFAQLLVSLYYQFRDKHYTAMARA
jgi:hypothetical protein